MANEKRLIDVDEAIDSLGCEDGDIAIKHFLEECPTVDAVELPMGKPGDYLEWDNGTGFRRIYHIHAVMICEDCMRYDIEICTPVVNHPGIVRIMSREEAEKVYKERRQDNGTDYETKKVAD